MPCNVETQSFFFVFQLQSLCPLLSRIHCMIFSALRQHAEESALTDFLFALLSLPPVHRAIDVRVEQGTVRINAVERPCLDETFNHALVDRSGVHALAE